MSTASTSTPRVLVYGSVNCDEFFVVDHVNSRAQLRQRECSIVRPGETISSSSYSRRAGGKGANQAVSASKAGASVDFAGAIGADGGWLAKELEGYGVGTKQLLVDDKVATGRAIIQLSAKDADNSIVLFPGSNFSGNQGRTFDWGSYSHLLVQNEIPWAETVAALAQARTAGLATFFNPSPMPTQDQLRAFDWTHLDYLLINEGEGQDLLVAYGAEPAPGQPEETLLRLRTVLASSTTIVMTLGANGVMAGLENGDVISAPAGRVQGKVVDTTGAGDCFTGYLATLLVTPATTGEELRPLLATACQAAAMCVEKAGAMESVPLRAAVLERMQATP
ncbi:hypothetical protein BMF94_1513 [Rhodotorula taiwanensis]|uniref:Ribokinase n=1 Tax=Rhodotorula taiwanensis TaxID=741276 RepID=A0A2S5BFA5_9BASI|nr:hypothetical protein BMF94_1513 [Rhodotorula taiwanensis]